jgi:hypothetical protein
MNRSLLDPMGTVKPEAVAGELNCYFVHNSLRFPALLPFFNASFRRPFPVPRQNVVHLQNE